MLSLAFPAALPTQEAAADLMAGARYSKVFARDLHYCLLEIAGDACTFRAITPEGRVLDSFAWRAREIR